MMKKYRGFTLLELLIVMTILGLLASIVVPRFTNRINQARRLKVVLQIKNFSEALEHYYVEYGHYPNTQDGLRVLLQKGKSGQSYILSDRLPKDPWGQDYQYLSPGLDNRDYDIVSYAADTKLGGIGWDADIKSWNVDNEEIF
ncbi:MAG: type II secretion system major pseudopilin GspG [Chlamydiota bacterium]|nr:type II secretion system major pseudopilin GspG [Chlamydiota bacterium]